MSERASATVFDAHVHLTDGAQFEYSWFSECGIPEKDYAESDLVRNAAASNITIEGGVFVEVAVEGPDAPTQREARWALSMADAPGSLVQGVVANIPVTEGGAAVETWLAGLRQADGTLPAALKGARQVLNGAAPDACAEPVVIDGIRALAASGLSFDVCVKAPALPHVASLVKAVPECSFVIDHLAYGGEIAHFKENMEVLARCPNIVGVKIGALEEWDVSPDEYLDFALRTFGFDRCLYEGNWFMSQEFKGGAPYSRTYDAILAALRRVGATEAQIEQVMRSNARRVYRC